MLHRWKQARREELVGERRVTGETPVMLKPDRRRQIDALIDYFGGAHEAPGALSATVVRGRSGKQFATDGPFAETKEQLGGGLAVGPAWRSARPPYQPA